MGMPSSSQRSIVFSALLHGLALLAVIAWQLHPIVIAHPHPPGTATGTQLTLTYQLGGSPPASARPTPAPRSPANPLAPALPAPPRLQTPQTATLAATAGAGTSNESSLGDGNISIALVQFHPRPVPDLSALPEGTAGDVILDAIIDAQGRVAKLTVTRGLGPSIDSSVLATVQQWTFTPATRNGVPTPSEQEILFHYERS